MHYGPVVQESSVAGAAERPGQPPDPSMRPDETKSPDLIGGGDHPARFIAALRVARPALLIYIAVRAICVLLLWIFAQHAGVSVLDVLTKHFDAMWYIQIADHGYDFTLQTKPDGSLALSNITFFPLFPALIALVKTVTFLPAPIAGVLVAWSAGLIAAWGIFALGSHLADRRTGLVLVAVWAALPAAIVESMAYAETIFTAIVAWALLAVLRRQWLFAGGLALLGGLTRPNATPLIAAVCLAALVAMVQHRDGWRPWVALVAAPMGYVGYLIWIAIGLHRLDGYFYVQRAAWNITFDGGVDTARTFGLVLTHSELLAYYVSAFTLVGAVTLLVLTAMDREPWPLLVFSLSMIVLTFGTTHYFWTKGRLLIPAVTLLLPIAVGLARARGRTMLVVLSVIVLSSAWYGTYLSLVWIHSP
jgi:hypothetical protein